MRGGSMESQKVRIESDSEPGKFYEVDLYSLRLETNAGKAGRQISQKKRFDPSPTIEEYLKNFE
jgi:hypothetical protein